MKTALLHYWLTNMRGGEKVLAALGEMLPEADVFTHAFGMGMREKGEGTREKGRGRREKGRGRRYEGEGTREKGEGTREKGEGTREKGEGTREKGRGLCWRGHRVTESFIARLPFGRRHPQAYLPLMPTAARMLNLEGYDLVVSSESGPIKGIRKPAGARHICYCHTPMRYLWDLHDDYYRSAGVGGKIAMRLFTRYLRKEDLKSADTVDTFIANSAFVAERIKRIYGREAVVIHPPVDVEFFAGTAAASASIPFEPKSYYLYAGELRDYKRPDLAVEACLKMNRNLVVVGNGSMREALARRAGGRGTVVFLGRVSDDELRGVYSGARALLFPGVEDFGIVPVEAQAAGIPVIALGKGGALETVTDGVSGLFFRTADTASLCEAMETLEGRVWSASACRASAMRFAPGRFRARMAAVLSGTAPARPA